MGNNKGGGDWEVKNMKNKLKHLTKKLEKSTDKREIRELNKILMLMMQRGCDDQY